MSDSYTCRTCSGEHPGPPLVWGAEAPTPYLSLPPEERDRALLSSDQCVIETPDDVHYFVRGRLEIPILGSEEGFAWLVWVSQSATSFARANELWTTPGREREPPTFGWLCSDLPYPETTLHLKTRVHTRPVGERPVVELEPSDHPLTMEQREGITWRRVQEIAERFAHPETK